MQLFRSHMPFITSVGGQKTLFFAASDLTVPWKTYYASIGVGGDWVPHPIDLGFRRSVVECAPSVHVEPGNGMINLTVVADYALYHFRAGRIQDLHLTGTKVVDGGVAAGYMSPTYLAWSTGFTITVRSRQTGEVAVFSPAIGKITRLSFMPEDETKLVVTSARGATPSSYIVDILTGQYWRVTSEGEPVYKFCVYGGELVHAVKLSANFESRVLVFTSDFELTEEGVMARDNI